MGQVNRIPRGFLDLVGAQTQGKNPPLFSDGLSPVVDMTPFYLAETLGVFLELVSHTVVGNIATVTVPQDETWSIIAVGTNSTAALATEFEQWSWNLSRTPRQVGGGTQVTPFAVAPLMTVTLPAQSLSSGILLPKPLVLNGGVEIIARVTQRDATPSRQTAIWISAHMLKG